MNVPFFTTRTVIKGRNLHSEESVRKRLKEIKDNPKSSYHKALLEGRIQVQFLKEKRSPTWTITELTHLEPEGSTVCGNCNHKYLDLEEDYLCPSCRSKL